MANRPPSYSRHSTGQARVRIDGVVHYLGTYGSPESHREYERLIGAWRESRAAKPRAMTIRALAAMFMQHAKTYYRKDLKQTSEVSMFRAALKRLLTMYGRLPVGEFGPLKLEQVQNRLISQNVARTTINAYIDRIRRVIAWGVSKELVEANVLVALRTVKSLSAGRSDARETEPVEKVPEADIEAALPYLSEQLQDVVRLMVWTGARPSELLNLRLGDIDRTGETWEVRIENHKCAHHDVERRLFFGPRARSVLTKYLDRPEDNYLFSPAEAEAARQQRKQAARRTKVQPSQLDRRKPNPKRKPRDHYDRDSLRRAVERACVAAGVQPWHPSRLRHNAATDLEKHFDLETAQHVLGHTSSKTTRRYAKRNFETAKGAMAEVG